MSSNSYQQRHPLPSQSLPIHHQPAQSPKHSGHQNPRIVELFEALKHEVEALHEEASFSKHHRKELEAKCNIVCDLVGAQMTEMNAFQQAIYDLERVHTKMKQQYEEEIRHLRHELESRGIPVPPSQFLSSDHRPFQRKSSALPEGIPAPNLSSSGRAGMGSFGNFMNSQPASGYPGYDKNADPNHPMNRAKAPEPPGHRQHRNSIPGLALKPVQQAPPKRLEEHHRTPSQDYRQQPPVQALPAQPAQQAQQAQQPQYRNMTPPTQHHTQHQPLPPSTYAPPEPAKPQPDELTLVINPKLKSANLTVDLVHCFDHNSVVCSVKFSPDGKYLATGCNHFSQIFEISTGRKILALVDESIAGKQEDLYIRSVCFSPDGVFLATGAEDRIVRVWDIAHGRVKLRLTGHEQDIYSLDWTKDGKHIVSGSGDHTVKIWDAFTGKLERTIDIDSDPSVDEAHRKDSGVTSVALSPTSPDCIVTGSLDEVVRVWDLRTGQLLERFEGHDKSVYSVAFSSDGQSVVSGSLDQTLKIWDLSPTTLNILSTNPPPAQVEPLRTKQCRHTFTGHQDYVLTVGYPGQSSSIGRVDPMGRPIIDPSFDVDWVVSGGKDRHVIFWNGKEGSKADEVYAPLLSMSGHKNSVISIALGPNHGLFATGSGDQKARIWRVSRAPPASTALRERRPSSETLPKKQDSPTLKSPQLKQSPPKEQANPVLSLPVMKPSEDDEPKRDPEDMVIN